MTYEEIKEMNIVEPYCFETNREEEWYDVGLINGADIGYKQGIKDTIEKVCEFLLDLNNTHEIMSYSSSHSLETHELIRYFKNFMSDINK